MKIDKYIGLPYQENGRTWQGVDCWGLARLFYKEEFNIDLPSYVDSYTGSYDPEVLKLISSKKDGWTSKSSPTYGDLCLFNIYGEPRHIGICIGNQKFLHSREGMDSVVESLQSAQWAKRIEGFYSYSNQPQVEIVGAPHPLKLGIVQDWTIAGTTIEDFAKYLTEKYELSKRLSTKLIVMLDGAVVPRDAWATTVLNHTQKLTYKVVATGGRASVRLLLTIAVMIVAPEIAAMAEFAALPGLASTAQAAAVYYAAYAAAVVAGSYLVNAIAPIRPPGMGQDPGQPNQLNLFNGSSNQANRFGAIPVVLGKVRYTGLLGATPYTKTLTDTNILNLLIIWGFGPLQIDPEEIYVGATKLNASFYDADTSKGLPRPYTLIGSFNEDTTQQQLFNKQYPQDVQQVFKQDELANNAQIGTQDWSYIDFTQPATGIDIVLNFPEGLRAIKTTGDDAGKVQETTTTVEIQVAKVSDNYNSTPQYQAGTVSSNPSAPSSVVAYKKSLRGPSISSGPDYSPVTINLYKWYIICLTPQGEIVDLSGSPTGEQYNEPSQQITDELTDKSLGSLIDATQTYTRLPQIPTDYVKLYSLCFFGNTGLVETIDHLSPLAGQGYNGFALTTQAVTVSDAYGEQVPTGEVVVTVNGGTYYPQAVPVGGQATVQTHFATRQNQMTEVATGAVAQPILTPYKDWSDFLKQHSIWASGTTNIDIQGTFTLTEEREVYFEAAVDDEATFYVDGAIIFELPKQSWRTTATGRLILEAGIHTVRITGSNSEGGLAGVAFKVTSKQGTSEAPFKALSTFVTFGSNDMYSKRKDPFNHVHALRGLDRAVYKLRVRRVDNDDPENVEGLRKYHKVALLNATAYDTTTPPLTKLPRGNLCRTVIQVQSSSKVNGNVDGVNALLQTLTYDWDSTTDTWKPFTATNNPASLFLYILSHQANAYRVAALESQTFLADIAQKVDLLKIQEWHEFCSTPNAQTGKPVLTYNDVITGTISVMDALRDVCAAGMASPIFIDGKWSVVIDKPRPYVVQHFTPHNSWGFEATKALPKIPDAFRITIQDESNAYQTKELIVYNYGKSSTNAEIFEELQLPGITNAAQAEFFGKWHLAQLKLRPETYTINTDFEYLVCNRGDLVKVTHDVPLWGSGSGRIKSISGNTITLTEDIYLEAGKQYRILIRTNVKSGTPGLSSVYKNIQAVATTGYYGVVTCSTSITVGDGLEADNLFIIGELNQETQELIVMSVEPSANLTARIVLTDYSPQIYTLNLNPGQEFPSITYNANITSTTGVVDNTITSAPIINSVTSTRETGQQIAVGTFQTGALVSFSNPAGLTGKAVFVQLQLLRGDEQFSGVNPASLQFIRKETGNYTFTGLATGTMYKVRIRYSDALGSVFGPWSDPKFFVAGASGIEPFVPTLDMDLEGTYIIAKPPQDQLVPPDFKTYEYRLYKDTGTEDFWELEPDETNNIKITQSIVEGRFNLLDLPTPRISTQGITYRVACRMVSRTNEYSNVSALGTIVVTTIT